MVSIRPYIPFLSCPGITIILESVMRNTGIIDSHTDTKDLKPVRNVHVTK